MFVGKRMTKKVIVAAPDDTLKRVADLLADNKVHRLPVVKDGRLVGIVSDSDIRNAAVRDTTPGDSPGARPASAPRAPGGWTVGEIMTREVITVTPWDTVEDALLVLQKKRLGSLPVVEGNRVVGVEEPFEVRHRIAHRRPFVEGERPPQDVRDPEHAERVLDRPRLGVHTVEDGDLRGGDPGSTLARDRGGDLLRLGLLVGVDRHRGPLASLPRRGDLLLAPGPTPGLQAVAVPKAKGTAIVGSV